MRHQDRSMSVLFWDQDVRCVETRFHGAVFADQIRQTLNDGLQLMVSKSGHSWLVDMRGCGVLDTRVFSWVRDVWQPLAALAGLARVALVVPTSDLAYVDLPFPTRPMQVACVLFGDRRQAVRWLRSAVH